VDHVSERREANDQHALDAGRQMRRRSAAGKATSATGDVQAPWHVRS
jgi:hypothetical protein